MFLRTLLGAATLLVGAVAPLALSPAPAHADACGARGVTVIVDPGSLGGGVSEVCVAGGGGEKASVLFPQAGDTLTYVTSQPNAICRVNGLPAGANCSVMPPANAYWALYWSDGTTSSWTYSSLGVTALSVPDGGAVAWAWQSGSGRSLPGVSAPTAASTPAAPVSHPAPAGSSTTRTTKPRPSKAPIGKVSAGRASAAASPSVNGTSSPSTSAGVAPSTSPSASPSASASAAAARTSSPNVAASVTPSGPTASDPTPSAVTGAEPVRSAAQGGTGLPGWVAPTVVVLVLAAGGAVVALRRRRA